MFCLGLLMCFVDKLNNWYSVGFCDMGCFNVLFRDNICLSMRFYNCEDGIGLSQKERGLPLGALSLFVIKYVVNLTRL